MGFYVQTFHQVVLNVAGTVEEVVFTPVVFFLLVLHGVTLIVVALHALEIRAVVVIYGEYGRIVVGGNVLVGERELHFRYRTRTGQTDAQAVVDGTLLELEAEAVARHLVVAGNTVAIHEGIRGTVVAL
ncbi:hypothetical protein Barb7_02012 [Bacteroidales bacterium Barb7]|nr:hypothetical protein Barb7_02012 [Bacteroidales bacterium Barb7]